MIYDACLTVNRPSLKKWVLRNSRSGLVPSFLEKNSASVGFVAIGGGTSIKFQSTFAHSGGSSNLLTSFGNKYRKVDMIGIGRPAHLLGDLVVYDGLIATRWWG
jgi:hypothetical protein